MAERNVNLEMRNLKQTEFQRLKNRVKKGYANKRKQKKLQETTPGHSQKIEAR